MATNYTNTYGSLLNQPQRSYTRQSGTTSGLGQPQAQNRPTCPTGYRWDTTQARCVAVNQGQPGMWSQAGKALTTPSYTAQPFNPGGQTMPTQAKPQAPQFQPYNMPKPNQLSPYAQLLAQAVDLNLTNPQQPYSYQVQPLPPPTANVPQVDTEWRPLNIPQVDTEWRPLNIPQVDTEWRPLPQANYGWKPTPNPVVNTQPVGRQIMVNPRLQQLLFGR